MQGFWAKQCMKNRQLKRNCGNRSGHFHGLVIASLLMRNMPVPHEAATTYLTVIAKASYLSLTSFFLWSHYSICSVEASVCSQTLCFWDPCAGKGTQMHRLALCLFWQVSLDKHLTTSFVPQPSGIFHVHHQIVSSDQSFLFYLRCWSLDCSALLYTVYCWDHLFFQHTTWLFPYYFILHDWRKLFFPY